MSRTNGAAPKSAAADPYGPAAADLPPRYTPKVAGYARGPFITPAEGFASVTPTEFKWKNCRTYLVRGTDGLDYRCVRVSRVKQLRAPSSREVAEFVGYWAFELLGTQLPLPEWED